MRDPQTQRPLQTEMANCDAESERQRERGSGSGGSLLRQVL